MIGEENEEIDRDDAVVWEWIGRGFRWNRIDTSPPVLLLWFPTGSTRQLQVHSLSSPQQHGAQCPQRLSG